MQTLFLSYSQHTNTTMNLFVCLYFRVNVSCTGEGAKACEHVQISSKTYKATLIFRTRTTQRRRNLTCGQGLAK
jgi:hypothetical protein